MFLLDSEERIQEDNEHDYEHDSENAHLNSNAQHVTKVEGSLDVFTLLQK